MNTPTPDLKRVYQAFLENERKRTEMERTVGQRYRDLLKRALAKSPFRKR